MDGFFEWLPNVALAGLAAVIGVFLWMIWRNISPAAPGVSLGYYEVLGRYAGQKLVKRIRGTLVDSTALFLNPEVESEFKRILAEDIEALLAKAGNPEGEELAKVKEQFLKGRLADTCRIIATREKLFTKHILIQVGHVDKPLNAYAANEPSSKFTLGMGFLSQGVITGVIHTFPQPWNIYKLGKVQVHLFKPDAASGGEQPLPTWLAKIALYAPASVELEQLVKSKDAQLREKDRKLAEMGQELSAMATERDALRRVLQGFMTTGELPESIRQKKLDIVDFAALALPTVLGYYTADYLKAQPIAGVVVGMLVGAFIIYKRR
ncbi:MAG: hypothetical protein ACPL4I_11415 [Bacteroidota bacterium]